MHVQLWTNNQRKLFVLDSLWPRQHNTQHTVHMRMNAQIITTHTCGIHVHTQNRCTGIHSHILCSRYEQTLSEMLCISTCMLHENSRIKTCMPNQMFYACCNIHTCYKHVSMHVMLNACYYQYFCYWCNMLMWHAYYKHLTYKLHAFHSRRTCI